MHELILFLFGSEQYMPHGYCFLWQKNVLWTLVVADLTIALAYFSIPVALGYFVYRRKDMEFKWMFVLFSLFIFACGTTHILATITIWKPIYGLEAAVKALTAVISLLTAIFLWPLIPKALSIPSPSHLIKLNRQLENEIRFHKQTKAQLQQLNSKLDQQVEWRTQKLVETNRALMDHKERLRQVVNISPAAIYCFKPKKGSNTSFELTFISDSFEAVSGFASDDWHSNENLWSEQVHPEDRQSVLRARLSLKETGKVDHQYRFKHKDGSYRWIHENLIRVHPVNGNGDEIFGAWMDITSYKQAEEELRLAATTFESLQGIMVTDRDANILRVNRAFTEICGYTAEEVIGKNPRILQSGKQGKEFYRKLWHNLLAEGRFEGEIWNRRKDGTIFPGWQCITAVKNESGQTTHYVGIFSDISDQKRNEEKITKLAFYDPLTKLPNRLLLMDRINHEIALASRHKKFGAIIFLDLDRFKLLNDSQGHQVGDELLIQVAHRLQRMIRGEDSPSRLGGDEFVLLIHANSDSLSEAADNALTIADKVNRALNDPYILHGSEYHFTASIGITLFPEHGYQAQDLIQQADTAMYRSKDKGKNTVSFYDTSMQETADRRLETEKELRLAIAQNQLTLHYQPQVDTEGRMIGVEALIRWHHPEKGLIAPSEFIPIAEETNLITRIGAWVIRTACQQMKSWEANGLNLEHVAINVSSRQFRQNDFVETVQAIIADIGVNPGKLMLELTENVLIDDIQDTVAKMLALKNVGLTFSIDDFGTGYSSLIYLKQLPLSQLKIDKNFIRDISSDANDEIIVETIIAMAHQLKIQVIAEGVESFEQVQFLLDRNCNAFQGFYFYRPMPADAIFEKNELPSKP